MGILFGAVIMYGAYQTSHNPSNYLVGLGASAVLAGWFINEIMQNDEWMNDKKLYLIHKNMNIF